MEGKWVSGAREGRLAVTYTAAEGKTLTFSGVCKDNVVLANAKQFELGHLAYDFNLT